MDRLQAGEPLQRDPLLPDLILDLVDLPHPASAQEAHHPEALRSSERGAVPASPAGLVLSVLAHHALLPEFRSWPEF